MTKSARYEWNKRWLAGLTAIFLFALISLGGCSHHELPQPAPARPLDCLKIAILQDKSGSVDSSRTPRISMAQFDTLIHALEERGGRCAFGFIDDDSNKAFITLRIAARPVPPQKPSKEGSPFKVGERLAKYNGDQEKFEADQQQWLKESKRSIADFKSKVGPMIEDKSRSRATDIYSGLNRADLYLAETENISSNDGPPVRYMLVISDGLDNMSRPIGEMRSQARIILVNGSASIGAMKAFNPERFEGIDAALLRITGEQTASTQEGSKSLAQK